MPRCRWTFRLLALTLGCAAPVAAWAELVDRGGGLIYDTVLNVTWLQDVRWVLSTSYTNPDMVNGNLNWADANAWAALLEYHDAVRNVTWTDWRLPKIRPVNGVSWLLGVSTAGNTDDGYSIHAPGTMWEGGTASELSYMYYVNLGNVPRCPLSGWNDCAPDGAPRAIPWNPGPFVNFGPVLGGIWSDTNDGLPFFGDAWGLDINDAQYGLQGGFFGIGRRLAWAVRDGDVAAVVPEAGTAAMTTLGLLVVGAWCRRDRRNGRA